MHLPRRKLAEEAPLNAGLKTLTVALMIQIQLRPVRPMARKLARQNARKMMNVFSSHSTEPEERPSAFCCLSAPFKQGASQRMTVHLVIKHALVQN